MASNPDLYAVLRISRAASADQIRRAYSWCMSTEKSAARRAAVQQAYAVLGDPRLRAAYDRGQVVGVGVGSYFEAGAGLTDRPQHGSWLERRWQQRMSARGSCPTSRPIRTLQVLGASVLVASAVGLAASWWTAAMSTDREAALRAPYVPSGATLAAPRSGSSPAAHGSQGGNVPTVRSPVRSGACYSLGPDPAIRPGQPLACNGPHLHEVIKVIDVNRLLGQPAGKDAERVASSACLSEFQTFTGLAGPTQDLWPLTLTTTAEHPSVALAACIVSSRYPRIGSARSIGS